MNTASATRLLALAILLPLTGCLQSTTTITVAKDGSGTIEEHSLAGAEFVALMNQFSQGLGKLLGGDEASPAIPANPILQDDTAYAKRSSLFGEGVSFVSAKELKDDKGGVGAHATYHFDDIRKVQVRTEDTMSGLDSLKSAIPIQMNDQPDIKNSFGGAPVTFSFEPGDVSRLGVHLPKPDEEALREATAQAGKTKAIDPGDLAQAQQFLGDMKFGLLVKVDGEVVSSDATHQEGEAATLFAMDFGELLKDPEAFAKLQALGGEENIAVAKKELESIEGITLETNESIDIRFK